MCVTPVDLPRLFLPGQKSRLCQRSAVAKNPDICLCDNAGIATDNRLVYGKRQGITQPASASNIAVPCANPVERGGARCVEDDPFRCTPERSSDECHPPDRNPR